MRLSLRTVLNVWGLDLPGVTRFEFRFAAAKPWVKAQHDRDAKFPTSFDTVFTSEGMEVMLTRLASPERQRLCGTVGAQHTGRMFGPPVDHQRTPPEPCADGIQPVL